MIYVGINRFIQVQFCANDPDVFLEAVKLALEEIEVNMVTSTSRNIFTTIIYFFSLMEWI